MPCGWLPAVMPAENSVIVIAEALLAIPSDEARASTPASTPLVPRLAAMRMAPSSGRRQMTPPTGTP
jgi:hypothetical protein